MRNISNPWIRRPLIVAVFAPAVLWFAARAYWCATMELIAAVRDEVPAAWRGPRKRSK